MLCRKWETLEHSVLHVTSPSNLFFQDLCRGGGRKIERAKGDGGHQGNSVLEAPFSFWFVCLPVCSLKIERNGMKLDGWEGGEDLEKGEGKP